MALDTYSPEALATVPTDLQQGSPEWWLHYLEMQMDHRDPLIRLYEDYYEGRHKLNFASPKFQRVFAGQISAVSDNWMPLVVRASVERLQVQGFRLGEAGDLKGDEDAWRIWQENQLDADSGLLFTEACKIAESALMVWYAPQDTPGVFGRFFSRRSTRRAEITVEHPAQVIVARQPGNRRRRAAALKRYMGEDGRVLATLFLPNAIYRFERGDDRQWKPQRGVEYSETHRLGIPVIPVVNDPHMLPCYPPQALLASPHNVPCVAIGLGWSDLAPVISTQDRINKFLCDAMVTAEFHGFPQRWATGLEVVKEPATLPDGSANPNAGRPIEPPVGTDRILVNTSKDGRFGNFELGDLGQLLSAVEQAQTSLAARTRTPPHYMLGDIVNASGDALKAAETGLSSKVRDKQRSFGEALEEAIRLAFAVEDDDRANSPMAEVVWASPEVRSDAELADSLVKKLSIGVPLQQIWADAGYSPQQISDFRTMLREQAMDQGLLLTPGGLPSEFPGTTPPTSASGAVE